MAVKASKPKRSFRWKGRQFPTLAAVRVAITKSLNVGQVVRTRGRASFNTYDVRVKVTFLDPQGRGIRGVGGSE